MTAEIDQEKLLEILNERSSFRSDFLAAEFGVDHQKIIGLVKSLQTNDGLVDVDEMVERRWELTAEGQSIAANGSHEYNVYKIVQDGVPKSVIDEQPYGKIGFGKAKQNGWVYTEMRDGVNYVLRKISGVQDSACDDLKLIQSGNVENLSKDSVKLMKNRKWINEIAIKVSRIVKGPNFQTSIQKQELDLTAEMVASGSWRHKNFKKYNFNAMGVPPKGGCLHPLLKVRSEFREIFFQMGFTEMETNRYVESSFWNFDALFQPQQHPARDAHDTFFLSEPSISTEFPFEYLEKVKKVHSEGGYGSIGYQYDWKIDEAKKNVLRTHTTAISARYLYDLSEKGFKPAKLFSIDRVFRNETLDATHLAEFHQVEGVVAERNLSLAHVIGLFTEFFRKCGIENLRFKPTYNPYTEPSMEVFAFHEGLNKWVEIGNSGMFRPEMLLPMGLPEDVGVAGFGLSLERPTMIRYGITNIRELFGHKINLETVQKSTICRLTKRN